MHCYGYNLHLVLFAVERLDVLVDPFPLEGRRLHAHHLAVHVQHLAQKRC